MKTTQRILVALSACAAIALSSSALAQQDKATHPTVEIASTRVSLDEYHQRLADLSQRLTACASEHTPAACSTNGLDDLSVKTSTGDRQVHLDWARRALTDAASSKPDQQKDAPQEFTSAADRIQAELTPANPTNPTSLAIAPVRDKLKEVLAGREFQRAQEGPGPLERARAAFLRWLIDRLSSLADLGSQNSWLSQLAVGIVVAVPCALLLWWIMIEMRKQRAMAPPRRSADTAAPSAREWQRWLAEAELFAREQRWREAVHHIYWASISRLEAHGLWPADRARTPREYLQLLGTTHALQPGLSGLTRSFERIWYGNRPAGEEQYREARAQMETLIPR